MSEFQNTGFAERLKTASAARTALLAKFQPKPTVTDPSFVDRASKKAAELERVRQERADAKAAAKLAAAQTEEPTVQLRSRPNLQLLE